MPYDAHTMEQKAIVASSSQKAKLFKDFHRAYRFVRHDPMFKDYTWWTQQPDTMLETLLARCGKHGDTLLHYAARQNDVQAATRLIHCGLSVYQENNDGKSPCDLAEKLEKKEVFQLLQANYKLLHPDLHCNQIGTLLHARACVNVRSSAHYTPLLRIISCSGGSSDEAIQGIKQLLNAKAAVNVQQHDGKTALHFAAFVANLQAVRLLIEAQANVNAQNNFQETALHKSIVNVYDDKEKTKALVGLLLNAHADTSIKNYEGKTALDAARERKLTEIVTLLEQAALTQKQKEG